MELAEGGDLFDKIGERTWKYHSPWITILMECFTPRTEADAGVSEDIAHFYFTQLISGVSYLHGKGIAHRGPSIKPSNIGELVD